MAEHCILETVKVGLGITGSYMDALLQIYIDEVKAYLKGAGASENMIESTAATGIIVRGVVDLWNNGAGEAKLSEYFIQRAIQLVSQSSHGGDGVDV